MDYHLERGLRLHTEPKYENLYSWAINEIDAQGQQIGHDQIPWEWRLSFTATSCVLCDSIDMKSQYQTNEPTPAPREIVQRQVIQVLLRPGHPRDDGNYFRQTKFSMFGTDRAIKHFQLEIHPIADPAEQERCRAWGSVSYTVDAADSADFRRETTDDCIYFYLFVKPETFARYGAKVAHGLVNELIFSVRSVDGFYSDWSPSISTSAVKVLTDGSEQKITLPPGLQFEPPRLGHVGEVDLYINRHLEFGKRAPEPEAVEKTANDGTEQAVPEMQVPAVVDSQIVQMLESLKKAAWFVVFLLAAILIVTWSKH